MLTFLGLLLKILDDDWAALAPTVTAVEKGSPRPMVPTSTLLCNQGRTHNRVVLDQLHSPNSKIQLQLTISNPHLNFGKTSPSHLLFCMILFSKGLFSIRPGGGSPKTQPYIGAGEPRHVRSGLGGHAYILRTQGGKGSPLIYLFNSYSLFPPPIFLYFARIKTLQTLKSNKFRQEVFQSLFGSHARVTKQK